MKKDNKGFSLIELMVAVVILALIVTPILHSFLTVVRTNAKSRRLLRTTTVAENIMEGLSGLSIEEIAMQFHLEDGAELASSDSGITNPYALEKFIFQSMEGEHFEYGEMLPVEYDNLVNPGVPKPDKGPLGPYSSSVDTSVSATNTVTHQFKERELSVNDTNRQKYYFYMQNVKEDRQEYDVRITLDASVNRSQSLEKDPANESNLIIKDHGTTHAYNEDLLVNIDRMNSKTDFTWIEPEEAKMLLTQYLYDRFDEYIFPRSDASKPDDINTQTTPHTKHDYDTATTDDNHIAFGNAHKTDYKDIIRNHVNKYIETHYQIIISVKEGKYSVEFLLVAMCRCPVCGYQFRRHYVGTSNLGIESLNGIQIGKKLLYDDIKNIYLFYYPTYSSSGDVFDYVTIWDQRSWFEQNSKPINIYIIKQKDNSADYYSELVYHMSLSYLEDTLITDLGDDSSKSINEYSCTNRIRSNLCTIQALDGTTQFVDQIQYHFKNPLLDGFVVPATQIEAKKYFGFDKNALDPDDSSTWVPTLTGESSSVNDYIYLKTVEIYPKGTFDEFGFDPTTGEFNLSGVAVNKFEPALTKNNLEAHLEQRRINVLSSSQE